MNSQNFVALYTRVVQNIWSFTYNNAAFWETKLTHNWNKNVKALGYGSQESMNTKRATGSGRWMNDILEMNCS